MKTFSFFFFLFLSFSFFCGSKNSGKRPRENKGWILTHTRVKQKEYENGVTLRVKAWIKQKVGVYR